MSQGQSGLSDRSDDPFMSPVAPEDGLFSDGAPWSSAVSDVERNSIYSGTTADVLDDVDSGLNDFLSSLEPLALTEASVLYYTDASSASDDDVTPLSLCLSDAPPNTLQPSSHLLQQQEHSSEQHASRPIPSGSTWAATATLSVQHLVSQPCSHRYTLSDGNTALPALPSLQSPHGQTSGPAKLGLYHERQIQGGKTSAPNIRSMQRSIPTSMPKAMKKELSRINNAYMTPPTSQESTPTGSPSMLPTSIPRSETTPMFVHMSRQEKMSESSRVIAIGAMQVFSKHKDDSPSYSGEEDHSGHTKLSKLVDEIEGRIHEKFGFDAKAQTGVEMIREVLVEKTPNLGPATTSDKVSVPGPESVGLPRYVTPSEIFPLEAATGFEVAEDDLLKLFTVEHDEDTEVAAEEPEDD